MKMFNNSASIDKAIQSAYNRNLKLQEELEEIKARNQELLSGLKRIVR